MADSIDEYLQRTPQPQRATLAEMRRRIREIVPEATECISYGLPAFRIDKKVIGGFAFTANGCSYYPFSGSTLDELAADIAGYSRTKSALHFAADKPLPKTLLRKLLRARLAASK